MNEDAVVNESADRELREQWQSQPEMERRMSVDDVRSRVDAADARRRRRTVVFVACGATIIPTWLAVMWLAPDFRVMAAVGLCTAVWILAAVYRTSVARVTSAPTTGTPSVAFYRTLLERERTYHRTLPVWFVPPVLLSTGAIVLTFARSARFAHTPVFYGVMAWYVVSAGVALAIGLKKGRREAARLQQELDALRE
jgi:hypothetical protein